MIEIRRGTYVLTVPAAAFEQFYKIAGWQKVEKPVTSLESKIRSLSNSELKKLAQEKGIETAGTSKKALIEALIDNQD